MSRLRYLVDTSAFARLSKDTVAEAFAPMAARGEVALCAPVEFELLFSARSFDDRRLIADRLVHFPHLDTIEADHQRALWLQESLARTGRHRAISLIDALVAATAERCELTVLHYDRDFELIADVTGQRHQWIVSPGTAE